MRRKDREVKEISEIMEIMKKCDSCSVAFFDEEYPYIVPMNFGFEYIAGVITLYFHSAKIGKKLDLLRKNGNVSFEMSCSHKLVAGESPCSYTMEYESVCGHGRMEILEQAHKIKALQLLMNQYVNEQSSNFDKSALENVVVMSLTVDELQGKRLIRNS